MDVVNVTTHDIAGISYHQAAAINKTKHQARSFVGIKSYLDYPMDFFYNSEAPSFGPLEIKFIRHSNILHYHTDERSLGSIRKLLKKKYGQIVMQHGRMGARNVINLWKKDKLLKRLRVVSTINLLGYVKNNPHYWLPPPIDIDYLSDLKRKIGNKLTRDKIVIHSPTNRKLKHTDLFLRVMKELEAKDPYILTNLVEKKPYVQNQIARARSQICFDQLLLQHGMNGLESMAMGLPVVAGCSEKVAKQIKGIVGYLPFLRATERNLKAKLEGLMGDTGLYEKYAELGFKYVKKWHSYESTAKKMIQLYEEALELL